MKKYGNIEILYDLDTEFFKREFIQKCRPAIIKGAVKSWPAFIRWDSEYLIKNIGNVLVKFRCANNCQFPNPDNIEENVIQEKTFSEYLKLLMQDSENIINKNWVFLDADQVCFFENGEHNDKFNIIASDFCIPSFISNNLLEIIGLWISKKGTASCIHYDGNACHNFNAQIRGSKRVVLFNPNEYKNLYLYGMNKELLFSNYSKVNWKMLNYDKFPNLKDAQYIEGVLEPGDALFLPSFWIHYFDHLDEINININYWWRPLEINLNAVSLSWALCLASVQMFAKDESNIGNHDVNTLHASFVPETELSILKNLEKTFSAWRNGRPG